MVIRSSRDLRRQDLETWDNLAKSGHPRSCGGEAGSFRPTAPRLETTSMGMMRRAAISWVSRSGRDAAGRRCAGLRRAETFSPLRLSPTEDPPRRRTGDPHLGCRGLHHRHIHPGSTPQGNACGEEQALEHLYGVWSVSLSRLSVPPVLAYSRARRPRLDSRTTSRPGRAGIEAGPHGFDVAEHRRYTRPAASSRRHRRSCCQEWE